MSNKPINPAVLDAAVVCLKTIAHPKRLEILFLLEKGARCVSDITNTIGVSQAVTSNHLRLMEARGILESRKEGKSVFYCLAIAEINGILDCIRSKKLKRSSVQGE